jgi:hypothetical protein
MWCLVCCWSRLAHWAVTVVLCCLQLASRSSLSLAKRDINEFSTHISSVEVRCKSVDWLQVQACRHNCLRSHIRCSTNHLVLHADIVGRSQARASCCQAAQQQPQRVQPSATAQRPRLPWPSSRGVAGPAAWLPCAAVNTNQEKHNGLQRSIR